MRILLASVLSILVIILWAKFLAPKPPLNPTPQGPATTPSASPTTAPIAPPGATPSQQGTLATKEGSKSNEAQQRMRAESAPQKSDTEERTTVVENDLYRIEFSNRGAVAKSWRLKKYTDDSKPPRVLDVVHPEAAQQTGGWPFSLAVSDPNFERAANTVLYEATPRESTLHSPNDLEFGYSDGHFVVTKRFHFDHSYTIQVDTTVTLDGIPLAHALAWRGGFGDLTVRDPAPVEQVTVFFSLNSKLQTLPYKKLNGPEPWGSGSFQRGNEYAGIEDRYFAAAFLPASNAPAGSISTQYWKVERTVQVEGRAAQEPVAEVAAGSTLWRQPNETSVGPGPFPPLSLRVYVGPKDYDDLKKMNPPLHALVQFGWMEFIADPIFHLLKWLHTYFPNWGWAIIALTFAINMLLFPLRISSYRTSLKMQRVAPEVKAIQERYKKYKMNDPRKAEMNKEVMAIYQREGINPVGGCLPMLLQFPIWFGLNAALRGTIELRHAPWVWIRDLSSKDPYYILPVGVGVSMYLVSKMTPMATADPQQQAMMKFMPLMFAASFVIFPFSSGLALYILTSSVVGIGQQWWLNKTHPLPAPVQGKAARGKK